MKHLISIIFRILPDELLNVPRVLLPYHPEIQVSFELVVTDPEGGCFKWRSTRSDIVSVKMIAVKGDCSDRAMIYATSKHASEQTAMIFAEDKDSGIVLSCGVAVDIIKTIIISTTTKVLFLDAGPSDMVIQAKNSEGDMFSNLGGIPFEWELESTSSKRPLRVVPFSQSKYEAPDGIRYLEENKKRGYVVLVEGLQTGTAVLKDVLPHEIVLLVVANLLLVPSSDLYLPVGAVVRYSAQIVKQGTTEPISLPSAQYQLEVADTSICSLNDDMSSVVTVALGNTEISLIDKNVKSNVALKPPSVHIYVVEPTAISFSISGDSWYLEAGRQYTIVIQASDMKDNHLYISDNVIFDTYIPSAYFNVLNYSKNGSYFEVKAVKSGVTKLRSQLVSVKLPNKFVSGLSCEQLVTISDPLSIIPNVVVFPYVGENLHHSVHVKAIGGTSVYTWSTKDLKIARIDGGGLITSGNIGVTEIFAHDVRNNLHSASASVRVLPPIKLSFGESQLEALVSIYVFSYQFFRVDSLSYRVTGKSVGSVIVKASASSAIGKTIYSLPHEIQIFAPINILPKLVTLIPESVFQFEISGGPQPKSVVDFALTNSSVALVSADGLITSKQLGVTFVSASLNMNSGFSKDSAAIKVVSLTGIKIVVSSQTLDKDGKAWARIEGIGNDESPFAFCGAVYPLHITWSLGGHGVVEIMSPLGMSVSELSENYFQIHLLAVGSGQTEVKARVAVSSGAPSFTSTQMVFEESVVISVSEPLRLVHPALYPSSIIVAPNSKLQLIPNR
uniref:BIG2 domain-containing protein n=1 Tax=Syphacia muris TaxID=451379 RepID=A0A0N5AR32_9BILA